MDMEGYCPTAGCYRASPLADKAQQFIERDLKALAAIKNMV